MLEPEHPAQLVQRQIGPLVEECIRDFRVTIINGPRQAGKTTRINTFPDSTYAFVAGVVFFTGERPLPFGDRLLALPISLL